MTDRAGEVAELGFDAVVARLRGVVERLEAGQLGLEDALAVYEEGVGLARRGHHLLDAAEKKVELLVSTSDGIETAPYPAGGPGEDAAS
ncbi:MAG: exodeoxyribonuclease VII small subunit [Kofleriaceae bacterium]|nr:exodeoxyribonuclease VII small subunit [Myxococcales bacterium]MCB9562139.1 exodeoxyribonuclease VII small subunit [Kofleriaceae bacterium]